MEILEDWFVDASIIAARTRGYPADAPTRGALLVAVRDATAELVRWLKSARKRSEDVFAAVKRLDAEIKRMERGGLDKITVRMPGDVNQLRRGVTRAYTIARTEFMESAYSLFEFFLVFVFLLLLACHFMTPRTAVVVTSFVSLTYWYLYRLIRDIDNPFDFGQGRGEVSLQPLERHLLRSEERARQESAG